MKDSRIIQLLILRSERAIAELNEKYYRYLYSISHNIVKNNEDAEECINEAYLKIWSNIPPIVPKSLKAYIGKVTRNISINLYRKSVANKRGSGEIEIVYDELEEILASENIVEDTVISREVIEVINLYLYKLTKEKRMMFILRYYAAYDIKSIAKKMNISESKVKMTLYRLRANIKDYLIEKGY